MRRVKIDKVFGKWYLVAPLFLCIGSLDNVCGDNTAKIADTCIRSSFFFDSSFQGTGCAWVIPKVGNDLYLTKNSGKTWEQISGDKIGRFGPISFIDCHTGWAIGQGKIWKTRDGGVSWALLATPKDGTDVLNKPKQLLFINQTDGIILEAYKGVWVTTDGGRTWQVSALDGAEAFKAYRSDNQSILLTNERGGLLRGFVQHGRLVLEKLNVPSTLSISDASFITFNLGWIILDNVVYRTAKDGKSFFKSFSSPKPPQGGSLESIHFINEQSGWVAGTKAYFVREGSIQRAKWLGFVFQTTDGGKTWRKIFERDGQPFDKIHFSDSKNGWLLADDKVLRSVDGGVSWSEVLDMKTPSKCS